MVGSPMCFPLILSKLKTKVNQVMTLGLSILSLIHLFILKKKACNINQASISQCIFFLTFLLLNSLIYHHVLRCLTLINSHFFAFQNTVFKEHKGQYWSGWQNTFSCQWSATLKTIFTVLDRVKEPLHMLLCSPAQCVEREPTNLVSVM